MDKLKFEDLTEDVRHFIAIATKSVILLMDKQPEASKSGVYICFQILQKMQDNQDESSWQTLGEFIDQEVEGFKTKDENELEETA